MNRITNGQHRFVWCVVAIACVWIGRARKKRTQLLCNPNRWRAAVEWHLDRTVRRFVLELCPCTHHAAPCPSDFSFSHMPRSVHMIEIVCHWSRSLHMCASGKSLQRLFVLDDSFYLINWEKRIETKLSASRMRGLMSSSSSSSAAVDAVNRWYAIRCISSPCCFVWADGDESIIKFVTERNADSPCHRPESAPIDAIGVRLERFHMPRMIVEWIGIQTFQFAWLREFATPIKCNWKCGEWTTPVRSGKSVSTLGPVCQHRVEKRSTEMTTSCRIGWSRSTVDLLDGSLIHVWTGGGGGGAHVFCDDNPATSVTSRRAEKYSIFQDDSFRVWL